MQVDFYKKKFGREGEETAAKFLKEQGFTILERNYRCRLGEIDLIASRDNEFFFIEVKSRHSFQEVAPEELISYSKQRHISRVAQHYVSKKKIWSQTGRFALVVIDASSGPVRCELINDIFELNWGY
ncbi:MAG: YraN family protein [Deltaproteobacteria bacterium]|nr:YraN family protein [Deltaproteobacteria bacterium]